MVVGPARCGRPPRRRHACRSDRERGHQPTAALAVGPLEPGLAARGAGRAAGRIGIGTPARPPGAVGGHRAPVAARGPAGAHGGAEVEHGLVPGPAAAGGDGGIGQLLHLPSRRASGRWCGPAPAPRWCRRRRHRARRRTPAPPGPCTARCRATPAARRGRRGRDPRAARRSRPRRGAGSPRAGCSRGRPTGRTTSATSAGAAVGGRGEPGAEHLVPRNHARDLRLLQHQLADQHEPRITGAPPREVATRAGAPVQQGVGRVHPSGASQIDSS